MWDQEITKMSDGTYTINFQPWTEKLVHGVPTLEMAEAICEMTDDAMRDYASNAMCED